MTTTTNKFNLEKVQTETPGCSHVLHFNNAGMSLPPKIVLETQLKYLEHEALYGGYETKKKFNDSIERVYSAIAELINCSPSEIAIIENATRAWDMAFYSIPFKAGDKILSAQAEYASNYIPLLQISKRTGAKIEVIPNDEFGQISIQALENAIDKNTKLISLTHIPTNSGLINPAKAVGKIARKNNILYLLDACQSVGHIPINVKEIGCDMLSATSRKYLRGPRGMGFLFVKKDLIEKLEPPFLDLHSAEWVSSEKYEIRKDARRFENWECNYAGKIGLAAAVDYAIQVDINITSKRVIELASILRKKLNEIPQITVQDIGKEKCGIVTFTVDGISPEEIQKRLSELNINVSVSDMASTLLDMKNRDLKGLVRASVHYYNSEDEIDRFCSSLQDEINSK